MKISLISKAGIFTHLIFLVPVRQYSRARGGNEGFPAQFLGNSYFCGIFLFQPSVLSPEGRQGEKDVRELMVASQIFPSVSDSNHLMSLEAEQSVAIFLLFILPLKSCKIKKETMRLQLQKALLPSFSVLVIPPDSSTQLLRRCHLV